MVIRAIMPVGRFEQAPEMLVTRILNALRRPPYWRRRRTAPISARRAMLVVLAIALCISSGATRAETAHVAVATNFKPVIDVLENAFESQSSHKIAVTAGSTGKLYAQIRHGAPYDVFLAADTVRPRRLVRDGRAVKDAQFTYAVGQLVLWAPDSDGVSIERLRQGQDKRIAIANPELAPYGAAAIQVLSALQFLDDAQSKFVLGQNIGQTFAFVRSGNATIGFVAKAQLHSAASASPDEIWTPPQHLYDPIRQDGVLLTRAKSNPAALAFLAFLKSDSAKSIIATYGYRHE